MENIKILKNQEYLFYNYSFLELCAAQIVILEFKKNIRNCEYCVGSPNVYDVHLNDAIESLNAVRLTEKLSTLTGLNPYFHFLHIEAWWDNESIKDSVYQTIINHYESKGCIMVTLNTETDQRDDDYKLRLISSFILMKYIEDEIDGMND